VLSACGESCFCENKDLQVVYNQLVTNLVFAEFGLSLQAYC
jgi:hypothetical protein